MNKDNIIPPMTHPYGMCWQQPPTYLILIDDTRSQPSALYNGKMWKAQYENEKTNEIDIAYREILIID